MTYIIYRLSAKVKKKFGADSCPEKCLHTELDGAEGGVDGQQHDALEAGELLSGKGWQAQEGHDKEHQRDIQDQGGVHSGNGAGLGDAEGGQSHGDTADQDQVEDVGADDVAQGQSTVSLDQGGNGGD